MQRKAVHEISTPPREAPMTWVLKHKHTPGTMIVAEYICPVHGRFEVHVERDDHGDPPEEMPCSRTEMATRCPCGAKLICGSCPSLGCFREKRPVYCGLSAQHVIGSVRAGDAGNADRLEGRAIYRSTLHDAGVQFAAALGSLDAADLAELVALRRFRDGVVVLRKEMQDDRDAVYWADTIDALLELHSPANVAQR